jgi:hypothetical protein
MQQRRASLSSVEAGFVLGLSYGQIRRISRARQLELGPTGFSPESVRAAARELSQGDELRLRLQALDLIVVGRLAAPHPPRGRWGRPVPITELPRLLAERISQRARRAA